MLLDKKKVSLLTKIGATVVAVAFIASLTPFIPSLIKSSSETKSSEEVSLGQQRKQYQEEVKNLEVALKANPKNLEAWIALGNAYFDWANLEMQLASSSKDREKAATKAAAYWSQAVKAYQQALALDPTNPSVRTDMAICYYQLGQVDEAVKELKEVLSKRSDFAPAYFHLGLVYKSQNKPKEAQKAWEKFLKLEPSGQNADFVRQQLNELKKTSKGSTSPPASSQPSTSNK